MFCYRFAASIVLSALLAASAWAQKDVEGIILYDAPNHTGPSLTLNAGTYNIGGAWNDRVSSFEVKSGVWVLYREENFWGKNPHDVWGPYPPGKYTLPGGPDNNTTSLRRLPEQGITLFDATQFRGNMFNFVRSNGNLTSRVWRAHRRVYNFDNKAASFFVSSGNWTLYDGAGFKGKSYGPFTRSRYSKHPTPPLPAISGVGSLRNSAPPSRVSPNNDLLQPRNNVARDSGKWGESPATKTVSTPFAIRFNGFSGTLHTTAAGKDFWHVQHIARLPNKNGRAYFMVTQSNASSIGGTPAGYFLVIRMDADAYDPATDRLKQTPGTDGEYVYQENFSPASPIGDWNHPGKMSVVGGVALIAAEAWTSTFVDTHVGMSEDAVLFYDVRDPENPKYWGKITKSQLGVSKVAGMGFYGMNGQYILNVENNVFRTSRVEPRIGAWTRINPGYVCGQHGMTFLSREEDGKDAGKVRVMTFDSQSNQNGDMHIDSIRHIARDGSKSWNASASTVRVETVDRQYFGNSRLAGWSKDTGSVYVTKFGKPVIYAAQLRDGYNANENPYGANTGGRPKDAFNLIFQNHQP